MADDGLVWFGIVLATVIVVVACVAIWT
jgi:hypothetical protein